MDDESIYHKTVEEVLPKWDFEVIGVTDRASALSEMSKRPSDLIVLDLRLSDRPDDNSGLRLLEELRQRWPRVQVIVFTRFYLQPEMVVNCMKKGAYYYFIKTGFQADSESFVTLVREALAYEPQHDPIEDNYPNPLALLYRDYRRNVVVPPLKFRRLIELAELLVKLSAVICLFAIRSNADQPSHNNGPSLVKPSFGKWFEFLQFALSLTKPVNLWTENLRDVFNLKHRKTVMGLIELRNDWLGHGATRPDHEYSQILRDWNDRVMAMLQDARVLGVWQAFVVKSTRLEDARRYVHEVVSIRGHNPKFLTERLELTTQCTADKLYLYDAAAQELLCLDPLVSLLLCDQCNQQTVFVYEKATRENVLYLDYANGHHTSKAESYRVVKSLVESSSGPR